MYNIRDANVKKFLQDTTVERRRELHKKCLERYPNCVPIIICNSTGKNIQSTNYRFIENETDTFANFAHKVRGYITGLSEYQALFWFTENGAMISCSNTLGQIYNTHANEDKMLYLFYNVESTFG